MDKNQEQDTNQNQDKARNQDIHQTEITELVTKAVSDAEERRKEILSEKSAKEEVVKEEIWDELDADDFSIRIDDGDSEGEEYDGYTIDVYVDGDADGIQDDYIISIDVDGDSVLEDLLVWDELPESEEKIIAADETDNKEHTVNQEDEQKESGKK